jgi:NitT/TauT family transport system permease protein
MSDVERLSMAKALSPETMPPGPALPDDAPPAAYRVKSRWRDTAENLLPPIVVGIGILSLWYFVSYMVLDPGKRFLLRPPHEVWAVGFADWDHFSEILDALWSSTRVAMIGLIIAIILGFALAMIMSQAKIIERGIFPFMVVVQAVPILAIVPLIAFWFGTGQTSRVVVCVIISLFPIIVNTLFGLQSAERGMHDLFTLHNAGRLTRLRKLMLPAAMPAIFAGLRISAGLSVIGAIVGDFFFGKGDVGIGQRLKQYASQLEGEQLLAAVIMSSALGVAVFLIFGWIQNRAIGRWHESGSLGS